MSATKCGIIWRYINGQIAARCDKEAGHDGMHSARFSGVRYNWTYDEPQGVSDERR